MTRIHKSKLAVFASICLSFLPYTVMAKDDPSSGITGSVRIGGGYGDAGNAGGGVDLGGRFGWRWNYVGLDLDQSFLIMPMEFDFEDFDSDDESVFMGATTLDARGVIGTEHFEFSGKAGIGVAYGSGLYNDVAPAIRTGIEFLWTGKPGSVAGGFYADALLLPKAGEDENDDAFGYTITGGALIHFGAFSSPQKASSSDFLSKMNMALHIGGGYGKAGDAGGGVDLGLRLGWRWDYIGLDLDQSFLLMPKPFDIDDYYSEDEGVFIGATTLDARGVFSTEHFEFSGKAGVGVAYGSGLYNDVAVAIRTGLETLWTMTPGTLAGGLYVDALLLPKSGEEDAFGYTVTGGFVLQFGAFGNSDSNEKYQRSLSSSSGGGGGYSGGGTYSSDSSYNSYSSDSSYNSYSSDSSYNSYSSDNSYDSDSSSSTYNSYSNDNSYNTTEEASTIEQWDYEVEHYGCSTDSDCSQGRCVKSQCVDCITNADCGNNYVCTKNQCIPGCTSDVDCNRGQSCKRSRCVWDQFKPGKHHNYSLTCNYNSDCASGRCHANQCVDCAFDSDCGYGLKCENNQCVWQRAFDGNQCNSDSECVSGNCRYNVCVECIYDSECKSGGKCKDNACYYGRLGDSCTYHSDCRSGHCYSSVCVECSYNSDCGNGSECRDYKCVKTSDLRNGQSCSYDSNCRSGHCYSGVCVECNYDSECSGDARCRDHRCYIGRIGSECSYDSDCRSGHCYSSVCVQCNYDSDCSDNSECRDHECVRVNNLRLGESCSYDSNCRSGHCYSNICVQCSYDSDCTSNRCVDNSCVDCRYDSDCANGGRCYTNTCYYGQNGNPCRYDSDCTSNRCINDSCVDCRYDSDCANGGRCFDNSCFYGELGNPCHYDSDCKSSVCSDKICAECRYDSQCSGNSRCKNNFCR